MGYLEAIVLGVIQGLTEFLPVSSSGHLALGHLMFGEVTESSQAFDVTLHAATLLVIFGVFGRAMVRIFTHHRALLPVLALALVPTAVVGLFFRHAILALGGSPVALAVCFAVTGCFLWATGRCAAQANDEADDGGETFARIGLRRAFCVGLAQALAVAPGVSRSGLTISAGRLSGIAPEAAVAFSFILGAPAILGAMALEARVISDLLAVDPGPIAAGFAAAFLSGLAAIGLLKWVARRGRLPVFAPYCFLLSAVALVLAALRGA